MFLSMKRSQFVLLTLMSTGIISVQCFSCSESLKEKTLRTVENTLPMPGVKDVVVAASPEGILIADKTRSSAMKPYAERLHTPVMYAEKSWGEFRIIDAETESLTIKITLSPGRSLTYHMHERRDETWTVIEGRGWVKLDGNEFSVAEGQTVRIPRGSFHTIRAETLLKVMEIQTGEDIDVEDKIVWGSSGA